MKTVGFVIITWNSQEVINNCLQSILKLNSEKIVPYIVVIDNGSTDNTLVIIRDAFSNRKDVHTKLISLDYNTGTTYSRNLGIINLQEHKVEYICILDSDTEINAAAIESMVEVLDTNPQCGIVGPRMHDRNRVYQESGRQIPTLTEKLLKVIPIKSVQEKGNRMQSIIKENGFGCVEVGYLMSACWVMRNSLIEKIGMLDEKIFYAPEDVDYCIRCWKVGYSVLYCYDADILHEWQRLSRKKLLSKHNYEHLKGLAYMFSKHKYIFNSDKIMGSNKE